MNQTKRHLVVRGEDGGEVSVSGDLPPGGIAEFCGPVPEDRRTHVEIRFNDFVKEPHHPRFRLDPVLGPGDVHDVTVAKIDEVPGREASAGHLVDREAVSTIASGRIEGYERQSDIKISNRRKHPHLR